MIGIRRRWSCASYGLSRPGLHRGVGKRESNKQRGKMMIESELKISKLKVPRLDRKEARPRSRMKIGRSEVEGETVREEAEKKKAGARRRRRRWRGLGGVQLVHSQAPFMLPLLLLPLLLFLVIATFHPAVRLINCSQQQQEAQPATSVWFMAAQNGAAGSHSELERQQNYLHNHHSHRHQQQQPQQQQQSIMTPASDDKTQPISQLQTTEENALPTPPPTRVSQRSELAKLELRIDRLEFELRKSIHQIQTSKSDHQQTQGAAGGANNPPDPRLLTDSNRATNMASSGLSSSWVDGGAGGRQLESSMTSGRQEDSKLIDLGERLNLVEKFITITTTKMYELEQKLTHLQTCECRKSCKWTPRKRRPPSLSPASSGWTGVGIGQQHQQLGEASPLASETPTSPTTDKFNARLATPTNTADEHRRDGDNYWPDGDHGATRHSQSEPAVQIKEDGQVWRDEQDKCNVCSCHRGRVSCKRVACPRPNCDSPQMVPGKCCPVCLKSCSFKGRSVKHGHKLVINSNEQTCKECLCLDGQFKCQRVQAASSGDGQRRSASATGYSAGRLQRNAQMDANDYNSADDDDDDDEQAGQADRRRHTGDIGQSVGAAAATAAEPDSNYLGEDEGKEEDEDEEGERDLIESGDGNSRSGGGRTRGMVGQQQQLANLSPGNQLERSRRSYSSKLGNELEMDDRFGNGNGGNSGAGASMATPLFCPLVECAPSDQFKLENDCCTYCRGFDFCSHDYLATLGGSGGLKASRCHPNAHCTNNNNYNGSLTSTASTTTTTTRSINSMFTCECKPGFMGDGQLSCVDIDECSAAHLNDCDPKTTICHNLPGSYECKCRPGFKPVSSKLEIWLDDNDELVANHSHDSLSSDDEADSSGGSSSSSSSSLSSSSSGHPPNQFGVDRHRKRTVQTVQAGERRVLQRCKDINECADGLLNRCHAHAKCINLAGSYRCHCKRGYLGNGHECHQWFTSSPSVAAYLHRHQGRDRDENESNNDNDGDLAADQSAAGPSSTTTTKGHLTAELSNSGSSEPVSSRQTQARGGQLQRKPSSESSTWVPLPPLNTLDEDDEQDDDRSDWMTFSRSRQLLPEPAPSPKQTSDQEQEESNQIDQVPKLSESKWEPLKLSFQLPLGYNSANAPGSQQPPSSSDRNQSVYNGPQEAIASLNTRTMFIQPPPLVRNNRPWWDQKQEPATTLKSTTATTDSTDVTKKQMTSRLSAGPERKMADQSDMLQRPSGLVSANDGHPMDSGGGKQDSQQRTSSGQQEATLSSSSPSTTPPPTEMSKPSQIPSQASSPGAPGHKRGTIITSASVSPGKGGRPANGGRAYSSYQQQKQFRSLGVSSSSSSSAAASSTTSSASPSPATSMISSISSRQSQAHSYTTTFITSNQQIIWSYLQSLLPTLASAILALIYNQLNSCIRINHIVTIYSA
uniref:Nidogen-2 n=1 Tax=Aceria tosichella TaxID=561515 RepID=A0A6G1S3U7_9ACAR